MEKILLRCSSLLENERSSYGTRIVAEDTDSAYYISEKAGQGSKKLRARRNVNDALSSLLMETCMLSDIRINTSHTFCLTSYGLEEMARLLDDDADEVNAFLDTVFGVDSRAL